MSIEALNWAFATPFGTPTRKLVMVVLANYADAHWTTFVGQERIAHETELCTRSVIRALQDLEKLGVLSRERRCVATGRRTSDRTRIHQVSSPDTESPDTESPDTQSNNGSTKVSESPDQGVTESGEPLVEPSVSNEPPVDALRGFDKFWELYPRRDGKRLYRGKAEQQWKRLSLEERRTAWRGAGHYAAACEQGLNRAADGFRWLRDRCWEDWQTPAEADVKPVARQVSWSPASAPTGRQFGGSLA